VVDASRNGFFNNITISGTCTGTGCGGASYPVADNVFQVKNATDATKLATADLSPLATGATTRFALWGTPNTFTAAQTVNGASLYLNTTTGSPVNYGNLLINTTYQNDVIQPNGSGGGIGGGVACKGFTDRCNFVFYSAVADEDHANVGALTMSYYSTLNPAKDRVGLWRMKLLGGTAGDRGGNMDWWIKPNAGNLSNAMRLQSDNLYLLGGVGLQLATYNSSADTAGGVGTILSANDNAVDMFSTTSRPRNIYSYKGDFKGVLTAQTQIASGPTGMGGDIGSSTNWFGTSYIQNLNAVNGASGYARVRTLELYDTTVGGAGHFSFNVTANSVTNTALMTLNDDAGVTWLTVNRQISGTPNTTAVLARDWIPATTATYGLGTSASRWLGIYGATLDLTGNLVANTINATGSPAYRVGGTTIIQSNRDAHFKTL
jgi:hypothetical protein